MKRASEHVQLAFVLGNLLGEFCAFLLEVLRPGSLANVYLLANGCENGFAVLLGVVNLQAEVG